MVTDSQGKEIKPGTVIAFASQNRVRLGKVKKITINEWSTKMLVQPLGESYAHSVTISRYTNTRIWPV